MLSRTVKTVCLLNTLLLCVSTLGAELKVPISLRAGKILEVKLPERVLWLEEHKEQVEPVLRQASKKKILLVLKVQLDKGLSLGLLDYILKSENEEFRCLAMAVEGEPYKTNTWQVEDLKDDQGQLYHKKSYLAKHKDALKNKRTIELKSYSLVKILFEVPAKYSGGTLSLDHNFFDDSQKKRFGASHIIALP